MLIGAWPALPLEPERTDDEGKKRPAALGGRGTPHLEDSELRSRETAECVCVCVRGWEAKHGKMP